MVRCCGPRCNIPCLNSLFAEAKQSLSTHPLLPHPLPCAAATNLRPFRPDLSTGRARPRPLGGHHRLRPRGARQIPRRAGVSPGIGEGRGHAFLGREVDEARHRRGVRPQHGCGGRRAFLPESRDEVDVTMTSYFYPSVPSLYPLRLHLLRPRGYLPSTASPASTIVLRRLAHPPSASALATSAGPPSPPGAPRIQRARAPALGWSRQLRRCARQRPPRRACARRPSVTISALAKKASRPDGQPLV